MDFLNRKKPKLEKKPSESPVEPIKPIQESTLKEVNAEKSLDMDTYEPQEEEEETDEELQATPQNEQLMVVLRELNDRITKLESFIFRRL